MPLSSRKADAVAEPRLALTVNGEGVDLAAPATLADLVRSLGFDVRKVAIELNLAIVPRSLYGQTALAGGDRIEIVHFIGGG